MTKAHLASRISTKVREIRAMSMPAGTKKAVYFRLVSTGEIPKKDQLPLTKVDAFFGIAGK
ncbi:MAG: hypothetical protein Q7R62_00700 [bacterium]|nr:hypothetical protein [bacterium]